MCHSRDASLQSGKVSVRPGREVIKRTIFNHLALVDDDDTVALLNRGHPMCNDDGSTALHGAVKSLLHDLLTLLVQGRRSLVQNQNLGVLDEGTGDSDSLLLTTREF